MYKVQTSYVLCRFEGKYLLTYGVLPKITIGTESPLDKKKITMASKRRHCL